MTTFDVTVQCDVPIPDAWLVDLKTAVYAALTHENITPPAALTLLLTDDDTVRQLNCDFRQLDEPTDVLSFPAGEPLPGMAAWAYLGDIAISVPYAAQQAQHAGHSHQAELQLLAIHGVLHLLGHNHIEPVEKAVMWAAQTAVLTQLGLHDIKPTE